MSKNINVCINCGKQGHIFHQCKLPIISYGVIVFRYKINSEEDNNNQEELQILMIRRKDSFGYIDFIRGKYSPYNLLQLMTMIDEMSIEEKERILLLPFDTLWNNMWGENNIGNSQYKNEEIISKKKFMSLKEGIMIDDKFLNIKDIVEMSKTNWKETEWEFPKGRRNQKEKDLDCAVREFEEETGISKNNIVIVDNILPFEEIFIGSNHKSYKHKYFLAFMDNQCDKNNTTEDLNNFQTTEVSKLEWKSIDKCLECIRPYNLEKKQLIININKVLQEYRLYS